MISDDPLIQAVALFCSRVVAQRALLQALFFAIRSAYTEAMDLIDRQMVLEAQRPSDEDPSPEHEALIDDTNALWVQAYDGANALVMLCDASLRRLYRGLGETVTEHGALAYNGVFFSRAIWDLANRYRHLPEWLERDEEKRKSITGAQSLRKLDLDAFDEKSTLDFFNKCGFKSYRDFEDRFLSAGRDLLPRHVTIHARPGFRSISVDYQVERETQKGSTPKD